MDVCFPVILASFKFRVENYGNFKLETGAPAIGNSNNTMTNSAKNSRDNKRYYKITEILDVVVRKYES